MRTYGRINQVDGIGGQWVQVSTDANGFNDAVWLTTLIQCLKLNLGEDPRFANYGIPAVPSVLSQIFPDYNTYLTQSQFSQYFASLSVQKVNSPTPTYNITALTHSGAVLEASIPA
jgi:hypothetical protein